MKDHQSTWTEAIHELGPAFAERAAAHDAEGSFVGRNYEDLKAARVFSAAIPEELGGGGATHGEVCEMLRTLAHYCPSTALSVSMHSHLVAAAVWKYRHGKPGEALLRKVADGQLVLLSTGAGDWVASTGRADRVEGGFRVSAKKRFGSGGPAADIAITSAPYEDPDRGRRVLHFPVPLRAEGVRFESDWDTLGMRATGSNTLVFDGVFVPDEAVALDRPASEWPAALSVVITVAPPLYMAPYVGIAEKAAEIARDSVRAKDEPGHLITVIGQIDNALTIAQMAYREMIEGAANYDFAPELDRANRALIRKTLTAQAGKEVLERAVEATGGAAFFRRHPLERMWRDIQASAFHPLPEKRQLEFSGRVALGRSPV